MLRHKTRQQAQEQQCTAKATGKDGKGLMALHEKSSNLMALACSLPTRRHTTQAAQQRNRAKRALPPLWRRQRAMRTTEREKLNANLLPLIK
ncbi:hypothetical protein Defa_01080 [Desulfovibrio sp. TH_2024_36128]|uniref:Uncharacterized protein n=1 Tax=Desulfovibrio falkowii TaxID=3136602 RepID=A0ABQ0E4J9_9BACT